MTTTKTDEIKTWQQRLEETCPAIGPMHIHACVEEVNDAMQAEIDDLRAAPRESNWSDIGRLIEAANGAAARGFISGTSNWAAFVSQAMGGQAREGESVANSAILARGRFHAFKGEDGEPDDWEWFEEGTNCEHGCIDAVIVRADAIAVPQPHL